MINVHEKPSVMPPKIYSNDLVRTESTYRSLDEANVLRQVMRGEETNRSEDYREERYLVFNMCEGDRAQYVTELYRPIMTEDGMSYKLIWHRAPRGQASMNSYRSMAHCGETFREFSEKRAIRFNVMMEGHDMCRITANSCLDKFRSIADGGCICSLDVMLSEMQHIKDECEALGYHAVFEL